MADEVITAKARIAGTVQRYLTGAETIRLTVFNSAANVRVQLAGRRFPYGGDTVSEFATQLTPTTNRLATVLDFTPGEGWLLGLSVRVAAGSPLDGQTYCVVEIGNGAGSTFQAFDTLIADTVTAAHRVAWPGSPVRGPLDGPGALRTILGTNPGAGNEIAETVPTGARWQLMSLRVQLVTSATVANRIPELAIDDGTSTWFQSANSVSQVASTTVRYSFGSGYGSLVNGSGNEQSRGLPTPLFLGGGYRLRTSTSALQVGDVFSAIVYNVREWLEGA